MFITYVFVFNAHLYEILYHQQEIYGRQVTDSIVLLVTFETFNSFDDVFQFNNIQ